VAAIGGKSLGAPGILWRDWLLEQKFPLGRAARAIYVSSVQMQGRADAISCRCQPPLAPHRSSGKSGWD